MGIYCRLACIVSFLCLFLAQVNAANLSLDMGDGTVQNYQNIIVNGAQRDASGSLQFNVSMAPGEAAFPIEANRIQLLSFGQNGQGEYFDLQVTINGGAPESYPGSQLISYSQQGLTAIAPGAVQPQTLTNNMIIQMAPGVAPVPTPVPLAPPPADDFSASPGDFNSDNPFDDFLNEDSLIQGTNDLVPQDAIDSATGGGIDEFGDGDFLSDDEYYLDTTGGTTSAEQTGMAVVFGLLSSVIILIYIYAFVLLCINIWFLIYSIMEGEILDLLLLLFCGIYPFLYAFTKYDGPGRLFCQIMYGIWLGVVLLVILAVVLAGIFI